MQNLIKILGERIASRGKYEPKGMSVEKNTITYNWYGWKREREYEYGSCLFMECLVCPGRKIGFYFEREGNFLRYLNH